MAANHPSEKEILKTVLEPLLNDFQYWFERASSLLESEDISFLSSDEQANLLARVQQAQQEVNAAKILFTMTNGEAGIDPAVLIPWHRLVRECWQVAMRKRSLSNSP